MKMYPASYMKSCMARKFSLSLSLSLALSFSLFFFSLSLSLSSLSGFLFNFLVVCLVLSRSLSLSLSLSLFLSSCFSLKSLFIYLSLALCLSSSISLSVCLKQLYRIHRRALTPARGVKRFSRRKSDKPEKQFCHGCSIVASESCVLGKYTGKIAVATGVDLQPVGRPPGRRGAPQGARFLLVVGGLRLVLTFGIFIP